MNKKYDIAVVIGRFQPVHNGHIPAFKKAAEIAETVVCIVGSANKPRSPKNPFTASERIAMLKDTLYPSGIIPFYVTVEDSIYQDQEWISRIKASISDVKKDILRDKERLFVNNAPQYRRKINEQGIDSLEHNVLQRYLELHGKYSEVGKAIREYREFKENCATCKIAVLGHHKDPSSYYLHKFADWDFVDIGAWVGDFSEDRPISATDIRELWFTGKLSYTKANLPKVVYERMLNWEINSYKDLKDEYEFLEKYRKETQVGPFPVQFLTTDAVVLHGDEVLMIRRGEMPGKGLWALPGGFKAENERFFESCVRELEEETGIAVPHDVLVGSVKEEKMFDHPGRSGRGSTVSMAYLFVLKPEKPRPRVKGGDDAIQAWWFPVSELRKMRDQIYEDHIDIIEYMVARA